MVRHELPEFIPEALGIGAQYKVTLRTRPTSPTAISVKERSGEDLGAEVADRWFLASLLALYGRRAFQRGNLDAGRINRLFGREIVAAQENEFDSTSFESELRMDLDRAAEFFKRIR